MVVHRDPEQDHEQEHRQPRHDRAVRVEADDALGPAVLEDQNEDAVRRAHREQVQEHGLDRDDDRPEGDEQEEEDEQEREAEHHRHVTRHRLVEVDRRGGRPGHLGRHARDLADRRRDHALPQRCERPLRLRVVPGSFERDRHGRRRLAAVEAHAGRLGHLARREREALHCSDRVVHPLVLDVLRVHGDDGGRLLADVSGASEGDLDAVVRLREAEARR